MSTVQSSLPSHSAVASLVVDWNRIGAEVCLPDGIKFFTVLLRLNPDLRVLFSEKALLEATERLLAMTASGRWVRLTLKNFQQTGPDSAEATAYLCFLSADWTGMRRLAFGRALFCVAASTAEFSLSKHWAAGVQFELGRNSSPLGPLLESNERSIRNPKFPEPDLAAVRREIELLLATLENRLTCGAKDLLLMSQRVQVHAQRKAAQSRN